ncbi:MAG: hypothetical protein ACOX4G_14835 [Limnochordia bacterium]
MCHATTGGRTHALLRWSGEQIVRYALVDNALQHPTARGAGWIAANGGKVFDLPDNPTKFMMDMPETIEALQYLQDLIWEHQTRWILLVGRWAK